MGYPREEARVVERLRIVEATEALTARRSGCPYATVYGLIAMPRGRAAGIGADHMAGTLRSVAMPDLPPEERRGAFGDPAEGEARSPSGSISIGLGDLARSS